MEDSAGVKFECRRGAALVLLGFREGERWSGAPLSPSLGAARGVLLALGAGLGPFVPMMFATRFAARISGAGNGVSGGWPWFVAPAVTLVVMWFVFGPGIAL